MFFNKKTPPTNIYWYDEPMKIDSPTLEKAIAYFSCLLFHENFFPVKIDGSSEKVLSFNSLTMYYWNQHKSLLISFLLVKEKGFWMVTSIKNEEIIEINKKVLLGEIILSYIHEKS